MLGALGRRDGGLEETGGSEQGGRGKKKGFLEVGGWFVTSLSSLSFPLFPGP